MDAIQNLRGLVSMKFAQEITAAAAEKFCEDFEFVEGRLGRVDELMEQRAEDGDEEVEEEGGKEEVGGEKEKREEGEERRERGKEKEEVVPLRSLFPRTSGEIRVLLS